MEYWKNIFRHIRVTQMIFTHLPEFVLPNDIHRANDHRAILSKTRFIQLGLNDVQHSNTPALQHSGTVLSAEPDIYGLARRTRFSILEQKETLS